MKRLKRYFQRLRLDNKFEVVSSHQQPASVVGIELSQPFQITDDDGASWWMESLGIFVGFRAYYVDFYKRSIPFAPNQEVS